MLQGEQKNGARGVMFQTFILLGLMVKIRIRQDYLAMDTVKLWSTTLWARREDWE